jgi:hypothetical protein
VSDARDTGKIKGSALRELLIWLEHVRGKRDFQKAWNAAPTALRGELELGRPALGALASAWYPIELVHLLLDELTRGMSEEQLETFASDAARATLAASMQGVQKAAFALLVAPERYPKVINVLFRMNYDSGLARIVVHGPRCHEAIVSGWRGHHPLVCRVDHLAKVPLYESMGCKGVNVRRTACTTHGDTDCRSTVVWET